jgi:hypothetical protein
MPRGRKPLDFTFMSYQDAKVYVRKNGIRSLAQWQDFCSKNKRPDNIPAAPNIKYKDEWEGFPEFLGYTASGRGRPAGSVNRPKEERDQDKESTNIFEDRPINTVMYTYEEAKAWCYKLRYTKAMYKKFITDYTYQVPGSCSSRLPKNPSEFYPEFDANDFYYTEGDNV